MSCDHGHNPSDWINFNEDRWKDSLRWLVRLCFPLQSKNYFHNFSYMVIDQWSNVKWLEPSINFTRKQCTISSRISKSLIQLSLTANYHNQKDKSTAALGKTKRWEDNVSKLRDNPVYFSEKRAWLVISNTLTGLFEASGKYSMITTSQALLRNPSRHLHQRSLLYPLTIQPVVISY